MKLRKLIDRYSTNLSQFDLVAIMTLILLLFHVNEVWYLRVPITVLAVIGLMFREIARTAIFWWLISLILVVVYATIWDLWIVNHKFAITYWSLAIAMGLSIPATKGLVAPGSGEQAQSEMAMADASKGESLNNLALCARILIGLMFLIATIWKIISPEFPDGRFFHFTLLTDHRFLDTAELVGGVTPEMSQQNQGAITLMKQPGPPPAPVQLVDTPRIVGMALFISIWTILIEGLIGIVFLWPGGKGFAYWRDWLLIIFIITTYPIATVHGFAWLIVIMAFAQCSLASQWQRGVYLLLFIGMPLMDIPIPYLLRTTLGW